MVDFLGEGAEGSVANAGMLNVGFKAALEEESVRVLAGPGYTLCNIVFCSMGVCTENPPCRGDLPGSVGEAGAGRRA